MLELMKGRNNKSVSREIDRRLAEMAARGVPPDGYSQREISRVCGLSQQAVAYIERRALKTMRFRLCLMKHELIDLLRSCRNDF